MVKKTFLKKLETSLTPLGEEKIAKIIKKYDKIIDNEIKKGKEEKDVISSLGSIDLLAQIYLDTEDDADINKEVKEEKKVKTTIDTVIDTVLNFIDETFKKVDTDSAKRILLIFCFVFIGLIAISLIHIPFRIADFTGRNILGHIFDNYYFYNVVGSLWSFGIGLCFFILIVWVGIKYINKIIRKYPVTETIEKDQISKTFIKEESTTTDKVVNDNNVQTALDIVFIILKVFVAICTIPFLMMNVALVIVFFFFISLIINGVMIFGPAILTLGLILLVSSLLDIIYEAVFRGGVRK